MKTYIANPEEVEQKWLLVDANGQVLGRLASQVATILRGKHKPIFSPHMDVGDHVVIINADKIRVTGKKASTKRYYRHTGYPGGLRSDSFEQLMQKAPEQILKKAIWGMMPHNKLGKKMVKKLRVYAGEAHPHEAQKPEKIELKLIK
ncbi:MAG: 50S ribosomal protein L13 [Caldithrix sp.]|nr:MAG: 50S ribosomal protein L13 [Caldithrix sp.]